MQLSMQSKSEWSNERPLEETAFHQVSTDSEEGTLTDVGWAVYFSFLAVLVIAKPKEWPAWAILTVIVLSAIVAVCRRRHIVLSMGHRFGGRRGIGKRRLARVVREGSSESSQEDPDDLTSRRRRP